MWFSERQRGTKLRYASFAMFIFGFALGGCGPDQQAPSAEGVGPVIPIRPDVAPLVPDVGMDFGITEMLDTSMPRDFEVDVTDSDVDSATFPEIPFSVETRIGERRTRAGIENRVTCQVLNQQGEPIEAIEGVVEVQPAFGFEQTEQGLVGEVARDYAVTCSAPSLGLRDATPGVWTVLPGDPAEVVTSLNERRVDAGQQVDVSCRSFDAYGNELFGTPYDLAFLPQPGRLELEELTLTIKSSGVYEIACTTSGVDALDFVSLEVDPGLPAQMSVILNPDQRVYRVGQVIGLSALATDRFGNPVENAPFVFDSEPDMESFGTGRYIAETPGLYTLRASLLPPTFDNRTLDFQRDIQVDFGGPGIGCGSPGFAEVIAHPPGQELRFAGTVEDVAGIESVTVDGQAANLQPNGTFFANVSPRWGLNIHDVVAVDTNGNSSSVFCAYYVAEAFAQPDAVFSGALQLKLGQGAADDGEPNQPLGSLADAIRRLINSRGLRDEVHEAVSASNPLVPNECRTRVLGVCLFRLGVDYRDYRNNGPNQFSFDLKEDAFSVDVELREQNVEAKLRGTLGNTIKVRAEYIRVGITFNAGLDGNGRPDINVRQIDRVQVGDLDADFSGLLGFIFELVFEAFESRIRGIVVDTIKGFLQDNIDRVLTDILGNVDIGDLGAGFSVPGVLGEDVELNLNASLETLDFNPDHILVSLSTKVDAPTLIPDSGRGIPLIPGYQDLSLASGGTVAAGVRIGLLNQILYKLWRAGYFELQADGLAEALEIELPSPDPNAMAVAEPEFRLRFPTPPWVTGIDGGTGLRVFVGPLGVSFVDGLFEDLSVEVATSFGVDVVLRGERDIEFANVGLDESLKLSFYGATVPENVRTILEERLTAILTRLIDRSLNDGLPSLPLPEFVVPDNLTQFDLPGGASLGLREPTLSGRRAIWSLGGRFGE